MSEHVRPWIPAAVGIAIAMAFAARLLWFWARRVVSFVADECDPAAALASTAVVRRGTVVEIVGHDFEYLTESRAWSRLIERWKRAGATVKYLAVAGGGRAPAAAAALAAAPGTGTVEFFEIGREAADDGLVRDYGEFHFVAFVGPDQLWLEGCHRPGETVARHCEYLSGAGRDERWQARRDEFAVLLARATRVRAQS
jgi:hypothetical protein